jgi:hypothetical protein
MISRPTKSLPAASATSSSTANTRPRKKSSTATINNIDQELGRNDSLPSIAPTERALVIEQRRTKSTDAEKIRLKASSVTNLLPLSEDDVLGVMSALGGFHCEVYTPWTPTSGKGWNPVRSLVGIQ